MIDIGTDQKADRDDVQFTTCIYQISGTRALPIFPSEQVGVLVLGFGGASLATLQPVADVYASLRPDWCTACTVRPALGTRTAVIMLSWYDH